MPHISELCSGPSKILVPKGTKIPRCERAMPWTEKRNKGIWERIIMKSVRLASMLAVAGGLAIATSACSGGSEPTETAAEEVMPAEESMAAEGCAAKPCAAQGCAAKGCAAKPCAAAGCGAKPCAAKPCAAAGCAAKPCAAKK